MTAVLKQQTNVEMKSRNKFFLFTQRPWIHTYYSVESWKELRMCHCCSLFHALPVKMLTSQVLLWLLQSEALTQRSRVRENGGRRGGCALNRNGHAELCAHSDFAV